MIRVIIICGMVYLLGAYAFAKSNFLQTRHDVIKSALPMLSDNITLTECNYISGTEFSYTFIIDNEAMGVAPFLTQVSLDNDSADLFKKLCSDMPYDFMKALVEDNTPIVYRYYNLGDDNVTAELSFNLGNCKNIR